MNGRTDNPAYHCLSQAPTGCIFVAGRGRTERMRMKQTDDRSLVFLRLHGNRGPVSGMKRKGALRRKCGVAHKRETVDGQLLSRRRTEQHAARFVRMSAHACRHETGDQGAGYRGSDKARCGHRYRRSFHGPYARGPYARPAGRQMWISREPWRKNGICGGGQIELKRGVRVK